MYQVFVTGTGLVYQGNSAAVAVRAFADNCRISADRNEPAIVAFYRLGVLVQKAQVC